MISGYETYPTPQPTSGLTRHMQLSIAHVLGQSRA